MVMSRLETPTEATDDTAHALRRLGVISLVFIALVGATYALPALHKLRPWIPGEKLPLHRLVDVWQGGEAKSAAGIIVAAEDTGALGAEAAHDSVEKDLGAGIAANLGESAGVESFESEDLSAPSLSAPAPSLSEPTVDLEASGGGTEPSPAETPQPAALPPRLRISDKDLEGLVQPIELPTPTALDPLWASLRATGAGEEHHITRFAHYGDSTIAADGITSTLRRRLQHRFGDAGHGFILIAKGYMPYGHKDISHNADSSWKIYPVLRKQLADGWYGYGGVQYRSYGGSRASFGTVDSGPIGTKVSRFELFYMAHERGGKVELTVDGGEPRVVNTRAEERHDAWEVIELPDGAHKMKLRAAGSGQARLYGVAMERPGPGVVYDSLGIVGARARRLLNADATHMARQVAHRHPDLLILAFGGNEADDRGMSMTWYEKQLTEVVRMMRAQSPEMPCLIFAPLDQAEKDDRGRIRTIRTIPKIVASQRRVAKQEGCAFFDTFQAMGGEGAMRKWFKTKPRLAWGDYRHATPAGYEVIGNMFYKAILKGLDDYLARVGAK